MNLRKTNKRLWYSLGLALLLCAAALVISTGTSFARYRVEREAEITFAVKPATQIKLGVLRDPTEEEAGNMGSGVNQIFDASQLPQWEIDGNTCLLRLAIANGISKTEYHKTDLKITLRLIATLGFWEGSKAVDIYLRIPSETAESGYEEVLAAVSAIEEGTVLHTTYGDGWIYTFQNAEGEFTRTLSGEEFSCIEVVLVMKDAMPSNPSLLLPVVFAEFADD